MGLTKSVQQTEQITPQVTPKLDSAFQYDGVPIDVYSFFSISPESVDSKDKERLKDIYEFAKGETNDPTLGNIMHGIRKLNDKIGTSGFDKQHAKVWNWIKLTNQIKDLDKRRKVLERTQWL